jgi:hypothetical protein
MHVRVLGLRHLTSFFAFSVQCFAAGDPAALPHVATRLQRFLAARALKD